MTANPPLSIPAVLLLVCAARSGAAQDGAEATAEPPVVEEWHVLRIDGQPAGYTHLGARRLAGGGFRSRFSRRLSLLRVGIRIDVETRATVDEDEHGAVLGFRLRRAQSGVAALETTGVRRGERFEVTERIEGRPSHTRTEPADRELLGPLGVRRTLAERLRAPGDTAHLLAFSSAAWTGVQWRVERRAEEAIALTDGGRVRATRLDVEEDGAPVTLWVDATFAPLRRSSTVVGTTLVAELAAREDVLALDLAAPPEVVPPTLVETSGGAPAGAARALYRVEPRPGARPELAAALREPAGQEVLLDALTGSERGGTFHVFVDRARAATRPDRRPPDLGRFRSASRWIESDAPDLREAAELAAGGERDPYRRALRQARWAHEHIRTRSLDTLFATAGETLASRRGDCTEHAVLVAALARASGIPARVAAGLLWRDGNACGHMWTEVWAGRWRALDATAPGGTADGARLALTTSSLARDEPGALLSRVARLAGEIRRIEVVLPRPGAGADSPDTGNPGGGEP